MNAKENIRLEKINIEKEAVLKNLTSLYLHDLSEFADDLKVNENGIFEYGGMEYYFMSEDLHPYLIYSSDEIAGFILLNSWKYVPDADYCINELFILKSFRGKGLASIAIKQLFEIHKGEYKVTQLEGNKLAIGFWKGFYKKHDIAFEEKIEVIDGFKCYTQLFTI